MSLRSNNTRPTFRKVSRNLARLAERPTPENVHKFRTSSRRVEVLVSDLAVRRNANDRKLLKLLSRLRRKAGRVRDLDVQSAALRSLKMPEQARRKSQLLRTLAEERAQREKRLVKSLDKKTVAEVRKRLKRAAAGLEISQDANPLSLARQELNALQVEQSAISESTLHQYRIAGKRARYIAELADKDPEAKRLIALLNHLQDILGDWHDWVQLAERAERLFGDVHESALVAALRNVTRAKFRQAVNALAETRASLAARKPLIAAPALRPPRQAAVA